MAKTISYFKKKGDPYILLTGLGLVISLGMLALIIGVILVKALGFFWPSDLTKVQLDNGRTYLGEMWAIQEVRAAEDQKAEIQFKIGNREIYGRDFVWVENQKIQSRSIPKYATTFERWEYGNFYGIIETVHVGEQKISENGARLLQKAKEAHEIATSNKEKIKRVEDELSDLIQPLTEMRRKISLFEISDEAKTEQGKRQLEKMQEEAAELEQSISNQYSKLLQQLQDLQQQNQNIYLDVSTADGQNAKIHLADVVRFFQPNRAGTFKKLQIYLAKLWEFVSAEPRESNTEGGVLPAIFGTVMMVLLMSIAVVPFGVLAALYLNEYAKQGTVIRMIRLSVNNLAGVPSIVFGIFGLGFFIYMVGGTIDQIFFSEQLPEPTFGTGGILWASLTLALLTLPVVVVATEEGILAVPRANKEGALALGATRWQMIRRIVLPNAMPGILTGLILAISRGAGEVAPLMITGVVKLAPSLPLDATFPFLHLDRKFMHLGFHIYDVGFQSPNVEAAKPMVYTTALLLIVIVILLNLIAIYIRNRLRKKFKSSAF